MTPFHEILCGFCTEYAYKSSRSKLPVLYARMLFSVVFLIKKSLHRILTLYRDFLLAFALRLLLDAGGHNIILPELIRRHADVFGKLQIEIALRVISHHLRDTRDGQVGCNQQRLCFTDAAAQQILHGRIPAHLLENMR